MPDTNAREGLTRAGDLAVQAREVDFVTRFTRNWEALSEILGIMRPVRKAPGSTVTAYTASVDLESGDVGEGEEIPYSRATLTATASHELTLRKYAKAVSIEAVERYGADMAVQKTDEALLSELQGTVLNEFYSFLLTGSLTGTEANFQMAVAMAVGRVVDRFRRMRRDASRVVVFVNTLDAYRYLGAQQLTVQTAFGVQYVSGFMGAHAVILSSEIPEGKVVAVPADNLVLYYVDPGDAEFRRLGLSYTVAGNTNLIGFHADGDYRTAVGECYALMGMTLWAEFLDGIAVLTIDGGD